MKLVTQLRQRLGWKLLLSYLLVLVIGVVVLDTVAELQAPERLTQNIPKLQSVTADDPGVSRHWKRISGHHRSAFDSGHFWPASSPPSPRASLLLAGSSDRYGT